MPWASSALMTPMWAKPRAAPPPRARAILIFLGGAWTTGAGGGTTTGAVARQPARAMAARASRVRRRVGMGFANIGGPKIVTRLARGDWHLLPVTVIGLGRIKTGDRQRVPVPLSPPEADRKTAPLPRPRIDAETGPMPQQHVLDNRQPQPRALGLARTALVDAIEALGQPRNVQLVDAYAAVADGKLRPVRPILPDQLHGAAGRCVAHGVRSQVGKGAAQLLDAADDVGAVDLGGDGVLAVGERPGFFQHVFDHGLDVDGLGAHGVVDRLD